MAFETITEGNTVKLIGLNAQELKNEAKRLIESGDYGNGYEIGTADSGLYQVTLSKASNLDPKPEPKPKHKEAKK